MEGSQRREAGLAHPFLPDLVHQRVARLLAEGASFLQERVDSSEELRGEEHCGRTVDVVHVTVVDHDAVILYSLLTLLLHEDTPVLEDQSQSATLHVLLDVAGDAEVFPDRVGDTVIQFADCDIFDPRVVQ